MDDDLEYDTLTIQEPRRARARWYTRLWPSCLGKGFLCCKKRRRVEFPLFLIGYDPVGQFQRAASVGDVASVERFINSQEYHINECDRRSRTSLHYACAHNHPEVVRVLLSNNAYINLQDDEGCTPLIKATQRDNSECVSLLLMQGADVNLKDFSGDTALHHAVSSGNTEIASKLLDYNADIDTKTKLGLTPYKLALFEGNQEMVQFLIQNGANTHLVVKPNSEGTSPEEAEGSKKKHVTFNDELHFSTDSRPLSGGGRPSQPIKSILKKSARISTASVRIQGRSSLRPSKKPDAPISLTEDEYPVTAKESSSFKIVHPKTKELISEPNQESQSSTFPLQERSKRSANLENMATMRRTKTLMDLSSVGLEKSDSCKEKTHSMVEEKAGVSPLNPFDHDTTVVQNSVHLEPTFVRDSDRRNTVQESHENNADSSQDIALDPTMTLGDAPEPAQDTNKIIDSINTSDHASYKMKTCSQSIPSLAANLPRLLVAYFMWVLTFLQPIVIRVIYQINQMFQKENSRGDPSNETDEQVAAEADP